MRTSPDWIASIRLVMFDVVGTTVDDRVNGASLVAEAMRSGFARRGIDVDLERLRRYRGLAKREAVAALLAHAGGDGPAEQIDSVHAAVAAEILGAVDRMREFPGVRDAFAFLKGRGVLVAVGSGLATSALERLVDRLGWRRAGLVDYVGSAEAVGAGRPDPALIRHAMRRLDVANPAAVLKVGDTVADVEEGKNAGARTAAVLVTQSREALEDAGAEVILERIDLVVKLWGETRDEVAGLENELVL